MTASDHDFGHYGCSPGSVTATVSPGGIVTGWSEGARRMLGYRAAEVVGRAAADLLATRESAEAAGLSLIDSQEWSGAAALLHRDGHRLDVTLHAHPSLDGDGRPQAFVVTATADAAESGPDRKMMEWAFAQASIALSTYTTGSQAWQLNAVASGSEPARDDAPPTSPYPDLLDGGPADEGFLQRVGRVAEEARPMRYEHLTPAPPDARGHAWIIEMWPVRDPSTGQVCGVGTATFDSSEQHRSRQRLALLNEAGTRIGTTLNVTRTAQELADRKSVV